jgi:glutamate 5-kinase
MLLQKTVSLLPVGAVRISGEFEKDDVVAILDEQGEKLGVGSVTLSSEKSKNRFRKKRRKSLGALRLFVLSVTSFLEQGQKYGRSKD